MPCVSIIIAVYNRRRFLAEAIESALNQSFQDCEIIIINDGSTEDIFSVVEPYLKMHSSKMRYIWQENQGAVATRNRGIKESSGKYIAYLDCDDAFLPDKLAKSVEFLEQNHDYAMVYSDMWIINAQGDYMQEWLSSKKQWAEGYIFTNLLKQCFIIPSNIVIRRSAFDQAGDFSPEVPFEHDFELWLRFARHYKIGLIKETLVKYRQHSENLSLNYREMSEDFIRIFRQYLADSRTNAEQRIIIRKKLAECYFYMGLDDLDKGAKRKARDYFMQAFKHDPRFNSGWRWAVTFLPLACLSFLKTVKRRLGIKYRDWRLSYRS